MMQGFHLMPSYAKFSTVIDKFEWKWPPAKFVNLAAIQGGVCETVNLIAHEQDRVIWTPSTNG